MTMTTVERMLAEDEKKQLEIKTIEEEKELRWMMEGRRIQIQKRISKQKSKNIILPSETIDRRKYKDYRSSRVKTTWMNPDEICLHLERYTM